MRGKITRRRIEKCENRLQHILNILPKKADRKRVSDAMFLFSEIAMKMRRQQVFDAGCRATKPVAKFEGRELGSMEALNFFDGYASKHPGFKHPYKPNTW